MCTYFFARAFVRDVFMLRLAPTIHCILTSTKYCSVEVLLNKPCSRLNQRKVAAFEAARNIFESIHVSL